MILFDIDGTLIGRSTAHGLAFRHVLSRIYNIEPNSNPQKYSGQTDLYIIKGKCEDAGLGERQINQGLELVKKEMCRIINRLIIRYPVEVYPGVMDALKMLRAEGYRMGIVTGNLRCIARAKLHSIGLWDYFESGGFGDNAMDRADLVIEAASGEKSVVFGDTPSDIRAAKEAGAISIGVASELDFPRDQLQGADMIIDSINPESVKEVLERFNYKPQKLS